MRRQTNLTRDQIRDLANCPTCGAVKGLACSGKKDGRNHHDRMTAAQKSLRRKVDEQNKAYAKIKDGGFYASWEWKRLRYEAIKLHGQRCQCCGWRPGDTPNNRLVVDHIKSIRRYPHLKLVLKNLQVLCNDCNMGKGADYEDDWRGQ